MELKKEQNDKIKDCYPKRREPAKTSNLDVLNAVLYAVENGSKWRMGASGGACPKNTETGA